MARKQWTPEEIEYLEERWGSVSVKAIAKNLGRTEGSVQIKAVRLGLGDPILSFDGITISVLAKELGLHYGIVKRWVKDYNLPVLKKIFKSKLSVLVIRYDDFWKWAESYKQMIDFSRLEENSLGAEPEWVKDKRSVDVLSKKKTTKTAWTEQEINTLKGMLNAYCYTYPEIAQRIGRSEAAIKRKILDLGLKARPVRLNNHIKYTEEEVKLLVSLYDKGYHIDTIAERLNKSALGLRGKLERMGYKFRNGVPYKEENG